MALTGFTVNGACSPSTNDALVKWVARYPIWDSVKSYQNGMVYPTAVTISATGKITYTLKFDNALAVVTNANEQLLACDPAYDPDPFSVTAALAAFTFFFGTMLIFYGWSKGAGAILEKIKRPLGRG